MLLTQSPDHVLMIYVTELHPDIVDDVIPLPSTVTGDECHPVHQVVEYAVEATFT